MRSALTLTLAAVAALTLALPAAAATAAPTAATAAPSAVVPASAVRDSNRVIVYYQKHYQDEDKGIGYISPLPLLTEGTGVDVVNVAAFHLNKDVLNLNDHAPDNPMYTVMWDELHRMQQSGIAVVGMIGGAKNDTWPSFMDDFELQYDRLHDLVTDYGLDGVDLDIELDEEQTGAGLSIDIDTVIEVIDRLRADFGPDFIITASPVAAEFTGDPEDPNDDPRPDGVYGVNFNTLYEERGSDIDWFNLQFYCGWGVPTPDAYQDTVDYQQAKGAAVPPQKLVIAAITAYENCTTGGWVPIPEFTAGLTALTATYPDFGGVAGWEYFNSRPGGPERPWLWASTMRAALDGTAPTPTPTTPATATPSPAPALAETGQDAAPMAAGGMMAALAVLLGGLALVVRRRASRSPQVSSRQGRRS
jgi:chitinase